jgi:hypothetical protein
MRTSALSQRQREIRECLAKLGELVDTDDVDNQAAAGAEAVVGDFGDARDFAAAAGDEHCVGVGQLDQRFGRAA